MYTKTDICNLAAAQLGQSVFLEDYDTDQSKLATLCRRFYDLARKATLIECHWGFARKIAPLGLLANETDSLYEYVYALPSDCLQARFLVPEFLTGTESEYTDGLQLYPHMYPAYKTGVSADNSTRTVLTNQENAELVYTVDQTQTALFSSMFVAALSLRLAAYVAVPLTGKVAVAKQMGDQFQETIAAAQVVEKQENQPDRFPLSESAQVRLC